MTDDDPVRLSDALASLTLPVDDPAEVFLDEWRTWVDDFGHPLPLPSGWRTEVGELAALGLTPEQIAWCAGKGAGADVRSNAKHFAYAMAVGWDAARRTHTAQTVTSNPDSPRGEFIANTMNGVVHLPTCYTLARTSPLNVAPVPHVEPYRPCRVCLG
jgi:hypothetical protein